MESRTIVADNRTRHRAPKETNGKVRSDWRWERYPCSCLKVAGQYLAMQRNSSVVLNRDFGGKRYYWERLGATFKALHPETYARMLEHFGSEKQIMKCFYDRVHKGFHQYKHDLADITGEYSLEHFTRSPRLRPWIEQAQKEYNL